MMCCTIGEPIIGHPVVDVLHLLGSWMDSQMSNFDNAGRDKTLIITVKYNRIIDKDVVFNNLPCLVI